MGSWGVGPGARGRRVAPALEDRLERWRIRRIGPDHGPAFARHGGPQVGFARAVQALVQHRRAVAKRAVAGRASLDQHAGGAVAQRVFDKGRRQLAGAQQGIGLHIGGLPTVDRCTVPGETCRVIFGKTARAEPPPSPTATIPTSAVRP